MRAGAIFCVCAVIAISARDSSAMQIAKIRVSPSGGIVVDGHAATLQQLDATLAREKKEQGEIWYYRESPDGEPTDAQIRVFTRIMNSGLHISLSTKPDFSDWVDEDGLSHPRNP